MAGQAHRARSPATTRTSVVQEAIKDGVPGATANNPGPTDNRGRHLGSALGALFKWAMRHRRAAMTLNPMAGVYRPAPPPASRARAEPPRDTAALAARSTTPPIGYPYSADHPPVCCSPAAG